MKKSFEVDYNDVSYPQKDIARNAIACHCAKRGWNYEWRGETDQGELLVEIEGVTYEVVRSQTSYSRGSYLIRCKEV